MNYTVIVPFYNEEKNISSFNNGLVNNLKKISNTNRNFENPIDAIIHFSRVQARRLDHRCQWATAAIVGRFRANKIS